MVIHKSKDYWKIESEPQIAVEYHRSNIPLLLHCHDFYEISFIISGHGEHIIDQKPYPLVPNSLIFIDPLVPHSMSLSKEMEYYNLLIGKRVLSKLEYQTIAEAIRKYRPEKAQDFPLSPLIYFEKQEFDQLLMEIILHTMETCFIQSARATANKPNAKEIAPQDWGQHIMDYIYNHYNEKISLEILAEKHGYAPAYISRYFKKQYGMNYYRYLTELRIKKAIALLKSTTYSVEKIALMVGYQSRSQFCKNFKAIKGRTVSEYMNRRSDWIREALKDAEPEQE